MNLRAQIAEAAADIGFDAVGITDASRPATAPRFMGWLEAGHHGEMGYMAREPERRADPLVYWPQARSMIVCLRSYAPEDQSAPGPMQGRVAAYAQGKDYHHVVKKELHRLGKAVEEMMPGVTYRAVIDTAAVLERAHAEAAGLGWFAKNTMLLSRSLGSYTFIGVVLLDRELPPDAPVTAHCGSCRACIDACPTGALLKPGVLDARRCISYLTIELRGDIPTEYRAAMGPWLFGCDACQEVCPWVKKAGPAPSPGLLAPIGDRPAPRLDKMMALDDDAFALWAQRSPIKRAKLRGMKRNAAICLGNSPDQDAAVATLSQALETEGDGLIRRHAAWALGHQGGAVARLKLEALRTDDDPKTRDAAEAALEQMS